MHSSTRIVVLLVALLVVVAGCRTMTGRSTGQAVDDATTTAKVKTALATVKATSVTRVNVDTVNGTVYLTGVVENDQVKNDLVAAARRASDGKPVVSNLQLSSAPASTPAASPTTQPTTPSTPPSNPPSRYSPHAGLPEDHSGSPARRRICGTRGAGSV